MTIVGMLLALIALTFTSSTALAQSNNGGANADEPEQAPVASDEASAKAGGRAYGEANPMDTPTVPGPVAQIIDGVAYAPADAPEPVKQIIWAGNQIAGMPYIYGGGHKNGFLDDGYDCSGTVSYALHGANLLKRPRDSRSFYRFGARGLGQWVTIFTNPGHAYMTVAGIRLDTSAADDPAGAKGPQWRPLRKSDSGYKRRHPVGL